jgi:hypothetical protein
MWRCWHLTCREWTDSKWRGVSAETGYAEDHRRPAFSKGGSRHLANPVNPTGLLKFLAELISLSDTAAIQLSD